MDATVFDRLVKIREPAPALLAWVPWSPEGRARLDGDQGAGAMLRTLIEAELLGDAARLLAFGLPRREAVWWACVSTRATLPDQAPAPEVAALAAAESWVYTKTEDDRRRAMAAAEAEGFNAAGSWCAVAAFWAEGSMAPPDVQELAAGPDLTPRAVVSAVNLASLRPSPIRAGATLRGFLDSGLDIAAGGRGA